MDEKLIFDVGMHRCEDSDYYLHTGYRVVAIDADPRLVDRAREAHADDVREGRLRVLHYAIGPDEGEVEFHLSENTLWNSLKKEVSGRRDLHHGSIRVPTRRLADLFREHGVPMYCKIDIEGYDAVCLASLVGIPELPRYVSVETECAGDRDRLTDAEASRTLDDLHKLGYRRFKLVDQTSLAVLSASDAFFREHAAPWQGVRRRLGLGSPASTHRSHLSGENRRRLGERCGYEFPKGASGPFGEDLDGEWSDYRAAGEMLLRHRRDYFRMSNAVNFGFWCDWHASF